jgi:hypothetical protein
MRYESVATDLFSSEEQKAAIQKQRPQFRAIDVGKSAISPVRITAEYNVSVMTVNLPGSFANLQSFAGELRLPVAYSLRG